MEKPDDSYLPHLSTMIQRFLTTIVALGSMLCAACYPVREYPSGGPRPVSRVQPPAIPQTDATNPLEQTQLLPAQTETIPQPPKTAAPSSTPKPTVRTSALPKTPTPSSPAIVTASKAPGREGYVLSPYTGKLMLVSGIPSGTVVPDQTSSPSEKKFFRVP